MKKFLFPLSMFFAGLILGVTSMLVVHGRAKQRVIDQCYEVLVQKQHGIVLANVVYATLLHDQKYTELNGLLEVDMVSALNVLKAPDFMDKFHSSAKLVRGYYDLSDTTMPSQLASDLANIKGTDVRRLATAMADPKAVKTVRDMQ